ncbi:MAG: GIY-YIG nuclease family protein [Patescibacteria group bacterium]
MEHKTDEKIKQGKKLCYLSPMSSWFVYIIRCSDNSLYTGISTDVVRRIAQHNAKKGAAYTRSRASVRLVWKSRSMTESKARKREAEIKRWGKEKKEGFIKITNY